MIKILARIPDAENGVSFYRGVGPLSELRRYGNEAAFDFELATDDFRWSTLAQFDILFCVLPHSSTDVEFIKAAKRQRLPVVVDYDDMVFNIPHHHPRRFLYGTSEAKRNLDFCINSADVVISGTHAGGNAFDAYRLHNGRRAFVIPSAWPDHLFPLQMQPIERKKIITWSGMHNHEGDLRIIHETLKAAVEHFPDFDFVFLGSPDLRTLEIVPELRRSWIHTTTIVDYVHELYNLAPRLHIVPLDVTPYNLIKGANAWLEATYANAPVMASRLPEFELPGVSFFSDDVTQNLRTMEHLLHSSMSIPMMASRSHLIANRLLSHVNRKRRELFLEVRR